MRIRGAMWNDAPAVLAVMVARHTADLGIPLFRLEELQDEWHAPDVELSQDAVVIEVEGSIAAYGIVHRPGAFALVAPAYERRGLGTRLLQWVEQRERERRCDAHRQIAASTNRRARHLLQGAGYHEVRSYWRMARTLGGGVQAADPPAGISLRRLDPDADSRSLHALDADSFSAIPDYVPESYEMLCRSTSAPATSPQTTAWSRTTALGSWAFSSLADGSTRAQGMSICSRSHRHTSGGDSARRC
ncbi:MAG: GNAT family N-acetyltransferase [Solirubrobacteraceae bacterium]